MCLGNPVEGMQEDSKTIVCDYLVIGAGASGMAFVDTLLTSTTDATVALVDYNGQPGGHWKDAYSFVSLHEPAVWYGVPSTVLNTTEMAPDKLANKADILKYYNGVVNNKFVPSGRVHTFFNSRFQNGAVQNISTGERIQIDVRRSVVDTSYCKVQVPSKRAPPFQIAAGVQVVPLNDISQVDMRQYQTYVVVGAGKSSMDAITWMLGNGINAEQVVWVRPRESWITPRDMMDPQQYPLFVRGMLEALLEAETVDDACKLMESRGLRYRIDQSTTPTLHKGATLTMQELVQLRKVTDVITGKGRIRSIEKDRIIFEHAERLMDASSTLYIDCAAYAFENSECPQTVFSPAQVTLQCYGGGSFCLNAAQTAMVESLEYLSDAQKNELCRPLPSVSSTTPQEWMCFLYASQKMFKKWAKHPQLSEWLNTCRLNHFAHVPESVKSEHASSLDHLRDQFICKMESGWEGLLKNKPAYVDF